MVNGWYMEFIMNKTEVIDLDGLSLNQAKKQVEGDYKMIRSESIRGLFAEMVRAYFQPLQRIIRQSTYVGVCCITRQDLERARLFGEKLKIRGIGVLIIDRDVSVGLASETISSISLVGFLSAPDRLFEILDNRFRSGIRLLVYG